jgi:ribosomal protein S25
MNNKKIGVLILIISVTLLMFFVILLQSLNQEAIELGCFEDSGCRKIETNLSIVHFAFGIFGFLFALGFYLLIFSKGEEAIVRRLEKDSSRKLDEEKFSILLKGLDEFEKEVLTSVKNQEGITQNTLRLKVDMSKAKLSQVLSNLEKKGLVHREKKKKTLAIYTKRSL